MTPRRLIRVLAVFEAITWTLLITALVVQSTTVSDAFLTLAVGIHTLALVAFSATALLVAINLRWSIGAAVLALLSAVIPLATIPAALWLSRTGQLDGDWRREATEDPRDATVIDRLTRWYVRHPLVFALILLVGAVFVVGPPRA